MAKMGKTEKLEKNKNGTLQRDFEGCGIRAVEGEGNERKFTLSFSSEEPYCRWFGVEVLSHKEGALNLERLNTIGCVLFNHNRDDVIGKITRAWVENERGMCEIELDDDELSEKIRKKIESGSLKGVSVGYMVDEWTEIPPGKKSDDGKHVGPCSIASRWTPLEVSVVSVPADPTVGVGRSMEEEKGVGRLYYAKKRLQINTNKL